MATTPAPSWAATSPMKLIPTPKAAKGLDIDSEMDVWTKAATMMALVHNAMLRAFNTVYHVAPLVPESDYRNFIEYAHQVYVNLHTHHHEEEEFVFPAVEAAMGKGLMAENVKEHEVFEKPVEAYGTYTRGLLDGDISKFDASHLRSLIDAFSEPLQKHLHDEIGTLLGLEGKCSDSAFEELLKTAHNKAMKGLSLTESVPLLMLNHDQSYEDGIHGMFPPMPMPVSFMVRRVASCRHWGWWKYASCDVNQMPQPLPYA